MRQPPCSVHLRFLLLGGAFFNSNVYLELASRYSEVSMSQPILNAVSLIAYQTGSVVSREIARKPSGSVTIFAFDEGQGLSEHTAPFDAMVNVIDGSADIFVDSEAHRLNSGDIIIMPAGHPHALKAVGPFKMILTMLKS